MTTINAVEPTEPTVDETIGHNVHELAWSRKIQQRDFAHAIGISDSLFSKKLRGEVTWSAPQIQAAANFLGVEPGRLFEKVTIRFTLPEIAATTSEPDTSAPVRGHLRIIRPASPHSSLTVKS